MGRVVIPRAIEKVGSQRYHAGELTRLLMLNLSVLSQRSASDEARNERRKRREGGLTEDGQPIGGMGVHRSLGYS